MSTTAIIVTVSLLSYWIPCLVMAFHAAQNYGYNKAHIKALQDEKSKDFSQIVLINSKIATLRERAFEDFGIDMAKAFFWPIVLIAVPFRVAWKLILRTGEIKAEKEFSAFEEMKVQRHELSKLSNSFPFDSPEHKIISDAVQYIGGKINTHPGNLDAKNTGVRPRQL